MGRFSTPAFLAATQPAGTYPALRLRRARRTPAVRRLMRETHVCVDDLIQPIFVRHGQGLCQPIDSMPGCHQYSVDQLPEYARDLFALGIQAVLLFGIPEGKDATGSEACHDDAIVAQAIRAIKAAVPGMYVMADVCCCEYTDHGHCGVLTAGGDLQDVDNDATLPLLAQQACVFAEAGADCVAPSGMMDGAVAAIRSALDGASGHPGPEGRYGERPEASIMPPGGSTMPPLLVIASAQRARGNPPRSGQRARAKHAPSLM